MKNKISGYVYIISAVGTQYFKIGISQESVVRRLCNLQTGCPLKLRYVYHGYVANIFQTEKELHKIFSPFRTIGEWFSLVTEDVQKCITLIRLMQVEEIQEEINYPILVEDNSVEDEELEEPFCDIAWNVSLVKEYYPNTSLEDLFSSIRNSALSGKTARDIIRTVLKLTEGPNHPTKSYTNHGKTLLKWLIINYDFDDKLSNIPEIQKLFNI